MRMRRGVPILALTAFVAGCAEQQQPVEPLTVEVPVVFNHQGESHKNFRTHMTGAEEVPANDSRGQGQATFKLSADGESMSYRLIVANIENVTMAHIHLGPAGVNGPVVVWLYPSGPPPQPIPGRFQGVLATGEFTEANFMGPLAGQPFSALLDAMHAGDTYVNVHTVQLPPGEIRGQID